jgi:hypothetical protein
MPELRPRLDLCLCRLSSFGLLTHGCICEVPRVYTFDVTRFYPLLHLPSFPLLYIYMIRYVRIPVESLCERTLFEVNSNMGDPEFDHTRKQCLMHVFSVFIVFSDPN